jgi:hypothetical protein
MIQHICGHLQGQRHLADAAGAGQREQANLLLQQQVLDGGQVMVAPDERCAWQADWSQAWQLS